MNKSLTPGSLLYNGSYKILSKLGQGGFSITYLANNQLGRKLTIKELFVYNKSSRSANGEIQFDGLSAEELENIRRQFNKEGQLLLELETVKNDHIVKVQDLFSENNSLYLVLDYVEGRPLAELVQQNGSFLYPRIKDWTRQIGSALSALHRKGLYHLDVKPGNIIITPQNSAVLIDFGLCRSGKLNPETALPYSRRFAAPEQMDGTGKPNARFDVYSFAATIYYALTGEAPPAVEDAAFERNLEGQPEQLKAVLARAMANKPADRYPDIYQFASALYPDDDPDRTVLPESSPVKKSVPKRKQAVQKPAAKKPALWLWSTLAVASIAVVYLVASQLMDEEISKPVHKMMLGTFLQKVTLPADKPEETTLAEPVPAQPRPVDVSEKEKPLAYQWRGAISGKGISHTVEMKWDIDAQRDADQRKALKGICRIADSKNRSRFVQFRISGYYDEELSNLHIETKNVLQENDFNYCAFGGDFSYEEGQTSIKARFQPKIGSGLSSTECKPFRFNGEIQLEKK